MKKKAKPENSSNAIARRDPLMKRFEKNVPRDEVVEALSHHMEANPRVNQLVQMLLDPTYVNHAMGTLCSKVGLSLHEVMDYFRKTHMDVGLMRLYKHVPDVLEDVAEDAKRSIKTCWKCFGDGKVPKNKEESAECPECGGKGKLMVKGDDNARKLVFEAAGLTGKTGPLVAQQFNFAGVIPTEDHAKDIAKLMEGE